MTDHDLLIRIDENLKSLAEKVEQYHSQCVDCVNNQHDMELDIQAMKSAAGVISGFTAVIVSIITAIIVALMKGSTR